MERWLYYEIPECYLGHKISEYLHNQGYSNQNLTKIKHMPESVLIYTEENECASRGRWEYMNYRFHSGDRLAIHIQEEAVSGKVPPVQLPFPVVYEDEDLVVVNKPAGMPVHPSMNHYENTLGNAAAWYYKEQGKAFVYRCVNRLDRDTTGLTILAKHLVSASVLYQQMEERKIHREYLAIVEGLPEPEGMIDLPLGRAEDSAIARKVDFLNGERAVTHYRVISHRTAGQLQNLIPDLEQIPKIPKEGLSLLSLHLETGRTHQIRVHMAYIGHPLIGDFLYNPKSHIMKRQALHAERLSFLHPITGQPLEFVTPVPEDMKWF